MARKVLPTTATTLVQEIPRTEKAEALTNLGKQMQRGVDISADIYKSSKDALSNNQFSEGSLIMDDDWARTRSDNANNLREDVVFETYDALQTDQMVRIDEDTQLTDKAKTALKERVSISYNTAKQSFRNNYANSMAKASAESLSRQLTDAIENRMPDADLKSIIDGNVEYGMLTTEAGKNVFNESKIQIEIGSTKDKIIGAKTIEELNVLVPEIKANKYISVENQGKLMLEIGKAKSSIYGSQGELLKRINIDINADDYTEAFKKSETIKEPEIRKTIQYRIKSDAGVFAQETIEDTKTARAEAVGKVLPFDPAKAAAAEAKLISTGFEDKKYLKFTYINNPDSKKADYVMSVSEHARQTSLMMNDFRSTGTVRLISDKNIVLTNGNASKALMMEINAIENKDLRNRELSKYNNILADKKRNWSLFDIEEEDPKFISRKWRRKGNLYPKKLWPALKKYDESTRNKLKDDYFMSSNPELLQAYLDGHAALEYQYENAPDFKDNEDKYVTSAMANFNYLYGQDRIKNSLKTESIINKLTERRFDVDGKEWAKMPNGNWVALD